MKAEAQNSNTTTHKDYKVQHDGLCLGENPQSSWPLFTYLQKHGPIYKYQWRFLGGTKLNKTKFLNQKMFDPKKKKNSSHKLTQ